MFTSESKAPAFAGCERALSYLLLALATVCVGIDLCMVLHMASPVPLLDHWLFLMPIARNGSYSLSDLWAQHNEHRLVIPKLFYLADFYWFRGTNKFLFVSIFIVQMLHASLLTRIAGFARVLQPALSALIFAFLFSPVQVHNFVWEFQICFVLGAFLASASAWSFAWFCTEYRRKAPAAYVLPAFTLSVALALCTTLSLANGLVLWPIFAVILIVLRVHWRYTVMLLVVGAMVFAAYFWGWFTPEGHRNPLDSLRDPAGLIHYLLLYIGGSWVTFGLGPAALLGGVGVALGGFVLVKSWRTRGDIGTVDLFVVVAILSSLATALETAMGRLDLGLGQATSSRYQTVAMVYWAVLALWVVSKWPRMRQWIWVGCFTVVALGPLVQIEDVLGPFWGWPAESDMAAATMISGVDDDDAMYIVWPDEGNVRPVIELLRTRRKSVFGTTLTQKLGARFLDSFHVDNRTSCQGQIRLVRLLKERGFRALELTGLMQTGLKIRNLVLVNDEGTISGFGFNRSGAWLGYSRLGRGTEITKVYGLLPGGSEACSMATFE